MVMLTTLSRFYDLRAHKWREVGETFSVNEKRAEQLFARIPDSVTLSESPRPVEPEQNLASMTIAELRKLAAERGIELPNKARKETIINKLRG